ncbi:superoxide dismutase family protein [Bizionia sp. KMM 8389]
MKNLKVILLSFIVIAAATACKDTKKETDTMLETETEVTEETVEVEVEEEVKKITTELNAKSGSSVTGNVVFREENGAVSMTALMSGLQPGTHAIHLHQTADCSSDDGKSTGGHWNPTAEQHGKWGDDTGYHKGDIGNFEADEKGNGTITFNTEEWCIGCGDPTKDIVGKAVIVHQGQDDFKSQPSGAAGARVSCAGVIQ